MDEMKELIEKRGEIMKQADSMLGDVRTEKRAFTDEEQKKFDDLSAEITRLDATIEAEKHAEKLRSTAPDIMRENESNVEKRAAESIVADYIRGIETRASEMTTTSTSTGRIVPSEFSKDIIRKTTELCGILGRISIVNSKGDYKQIIADNEKKFRRAGLTRSELSQLPKLNLPQLR